MYGNSTTNKFLPAKNNKLSSENKSCTINDLKCQGLTVSLKMSFLQIKQGKERNCLSQSFYCLNYTKREAGGASLLVIKICFWNLILLTYNARPPSTKVAWVRFTDLALCVSLVGWFSLFPFLKFFFPLFLWFDFQSLHFLIFV